MEVNVVETNDAMPPGFKPCAAGTHEIVVDYKGLISLPFDTHNDGMKCARVLIFLRGKAVHVPNVTGQYVTVAPYDVIVAPCIVHFAGGVRKPELCVSFTDFAATNGELAGVSCESIALPLKLAGGKFRTQVNFTQASMVLGFSPVPPGETTINLPSTLKNISPFKQFGVSTVSTVLTLIGTGLGKRIPVLREHAQARIKAHVDAIKKAGDAAAAASQEGICIARLERIVSIVNALPPLNYDARLSSRVTLLATNESGFIVGRPDWLASPLKTQLLSGAAAVLQRSQFVETRAGVAAAAAAAAMEPGAGAPAAAAAAAIASETVINNDASRSTSPSHFSSDGEDVQFVDSNSCNLVDDADSPCPKTRKRTAPAAFVFAPTAKKLKATERKSVKSSRKGQAATAATAAKGLNRYGKPYKRGPYNSTQNPKPAKVATLGQEAAANSLRIKVLEAQLLVAQQAVADKVDSAKHETCALMRLELQQQYMLGLSHGSMLARGEAISLTPFPPSSAGSSSK